MTTIPNRRAENFDRALTAGGTSADATMAALVAVAGALAAVPQVPAPAFREGLRARLMAEAAQLAAAPTAAAPPAAAPAPPAFPASPLHTLAKVLAKPAMQVATGGLAATIAAAGVGVGASRSLPGDTLYGVRRAFGGGQSASGDVSGKVGEIVALLERDGAAALATVETTLTGVKADLDALTADLLAQARAGSRAAYDRLRAEVEQLTNLLQSLRGQLPTEAQDELDAAMATLNAARAQLNAIPLPGGTPGVPGRPGPTGSPRPSGSPSEKPTSKPSSPPPVTPTTITPSAPPVTLPTGTPPPVTPVPTGGPTLPVSVPTLLP